MATLKTINDLFREKGFDFLQTNPHYGVTAQKAVKAMSRCRTAEMGGRVQECDECGHKIVLYNSCRNRHCPQCQSMKKEQWIEEKKNELFPFPYFHVVFTIPDELNPLVYRNKKALYDLLFSSVKESLLSMSSEQKYFGARIGYFAVLHTWGQKLNLHPHLHCVVPGGGYSERKKKWISCKKDWLLPVKALSKRFRSIFLCALKKLYHNGDLYLINCKYQKKSAFYDLINSCFEKEWVVYVKETFKHTERVIQYLAKYTHRIAISNYRIKKIDAQNVFFSYKDYRDGKKKLTSFTHKQFMRRYLLHVLPFRFVRIRYFGIYAHCNKSRCINEARIAFDIKNAEGAEEEIAGDWDSVFLKVYGREAAKCPVCEKGNLITRILLPQPRSPPRITITKATA